MSLDFGFLPSTTRATDIQIFQRGATVTNTQWKSWVRPRGTTMAHIMCVGGGGGGGGGFTGVAASARGGGGAGGSSGITRVTVPLYFLSDQLFIQVGAGGQGVLSGGGVAGSGILSYVSMAPDNGILNLICLSGSAAAVGGTTGTVAAGGAGGAGSTIAVLGSMPLMNSGHFSAVAGQAGTGGGAQTGAVGGALTIPTTGALSMPGTGGGGVTAADFAGGLVNQTANAWLSEQRPSNAAAGSNNGCGGTMLWEPFFAWGGMGGGSSNAGVGGAGGIGAVGAGGGGGGGGTTGGRGGNGGDGVVIIISW